MITKTKCFIRALNISLYNIKDKYCQTPKLLLSFELLFKIFNSFDYQAIFQSSLKLKKLFTAVIILVFFV